MTPQDQDPIIAPINRGIEKGFRVDVEAPLGLRKKLFKKTNGEVNHALSLERPYILGKRSEKHFT